jgi:hypothetical protein
LCWKASAEKQSRMKKRRRHRDMGEFGKITRKIKNEKRGNLYCRIVERSDKEMINTALHADKIIGKQLLAIRSGIPLMLEIGLYTVEEAVEIVKHIEAVMKIISERDAEKTGNRVADLSIRRIAKMVGGEVVEEEKE